MKQIINISTLFMLTCGLLFYGCHPRTGQPINGQPERQLSSEDWSKQGISFLDSHRYEEAIKALTKALEINPRNAEAYYNRGYAWRMKGDLVQALTDFKMALSLMPNNKQIKTSVAILENELNWEKTEKKYFRKRIDNPTLK